MYHYLVNLQLNIKLSIENSVVFFYEHRMKLEKTAPEVDHFCLQDSVVRAWIAL